ncbi:MAG: peptidylprolyl isomerase [Polyangiaceae bacterium]
MILSLIGLGAAACAPPPPPAEPDTPTVSTEPTTSASAAVAIAEPEPACREGEVRTDGGCEPDGVIDAIVERAEPEPVATPTAKGPFPVSTHAAMTNPALANTKAPHHFAVRFDTTVGSFTVKCDRSWAPHGADRFFNLVKIGYFDDVAFFRAVKGFVVQFGIHGDPAVNAAWKKTNLTPDVVHASNEEGTLTFAQAGSPAAPGKTADSRTVQLFFNLTDNSRLDAMGFAPLCKVTANELDVVKRIHTGHGETAGRDQSNIQAEGNAYLRQKYPELDYIRSARVVLP